MYAMFPHKPYPWVQLAGHSEGFEKGVSPTSILKRSSSMEKVRGPSWGAGDGPLSFPPAD